MSTPSLPIISLRKIVEGPNREEEIARLREVTHTIGFFYLADHDVPKAQQDELFATVKEFFSLPQEQKEEISNLKNPHYRGYAKLGDERTQEKVDWREQIDYAADRPVETEGLEDHPWRVLEGPNPWPSALPQVKNQVTDWQNKLTEISNQLLSAWAESLGQPADFFEPAFEKPYPLLKLVHYPAPLKQESEQGVGAHHDAGVLTLLLIEEDSTGLQVLKDNQWIDVEPLPNHFIVNIGELLEVATDGYLVATKHRVLPPEPGKDRYSIPFFLTPSLDAALPHVELPAELAKEAPGAGKDLEGQEIYDVSGRNLLKSRLRAHPETTEIFHAELAESLV
ncbi:isopenicillin N synthase family dioxygenase [Corynebacterium sp. S7]